jgi:hypothetical protein
LDISSGSRCIGFYETKVQTANVFCLKRDYMSTEAQTNGLPARVRLTLSRADVSAREAVAIIADHAGNTIDLKKALSVTIAGAADVNGRLNIANGAWDVRF